ncbi:MULTISPECIES: hypothetical protein [Bacillales]|uniref:hypothetical protein n=1 Tax=Bacillales TaxID=1385 RepID=UPI00164309AC|nr:hypothetical protein [Paenibacillus sp. Y412MC10]
METVLFSYALIQLVDGGSQLVSNLPVRPHSNGYHCRSTAWQKPANGNTRLRV